MLKQINIKCPNSLILTFMVLSVLSGCRKFVEVDTPKGQLTTETVFSDDATATTALISIYETMSSTSMNFASGSQSMSLLAGLGADELDNYATNPNQVQYFANSISPSNTYNFATWSQLYKGIYIANDVLEGLQGSNGVTQPIKDELRGEALFLRAFFYFYLVNLYGDVPLPLTTQFEVNNSLYRIPPSAIYEQIITDLKSSTELLADDYQLFGQERTRANKFAAIALLARVYLYTHNWKEAINASSQVIDNAVLYNLAEDLSATFKKNSSEAILQLQPTLPGYNTFDANVFILNSAPTLVAMKSSLIKLFETGDIRKSSWTDSIIVSGNSYYFPTKYKAKVGAGVTEYLMMFRFAEQFLIRAEAFAQNNDLSDAVSDLNTIRQRAKLPPVNPQTQAQILEVIAHERQVELFAEWGHRWFDLKRTGTADLILKESKGAGWKATDTLYPIPQNERTKNSHLSQNPGY